MAHLELGVLLSQVVLHMQQVLCRKLAQAEDAQEVEVCQVAGVLPIYVTKSHNPNHLLKHVQVCLPDLQRRRRRILQAHMAARECYGNVVLWCCDAVTVASAG